MRIFVTGHRNPDMDSVCAAYSYAVLKNRIDSANEYIPAMLGSGNSNTKKVFSDLGLAMPQFLRDVRPRVGEVQRKATVSVSSSDPLYLLLDIFQRRHPSVVPVIDNGEFKGLLSADDINGFFLRENSGAVRQRYLLSEGKFCLHRFGLDCLKLYGRPAVSVFRDQEQGSTVSEK